MAKTGAVFQLEQFSVDTATQAFTAATHFPLALHRNEATILKKCSQNIKKVCENTFKQSPYVCLRQS